MAGTAPTGAAWAQSKAGTAIGQFLGIEPSARHSGMGNAGSAVPMGIASVYFNPGVIGALEEPAIQLTHSPWYAGISFDYVAAAFPVREWGSLFASVTALNSGEIAVRTEEQPLGTGEQFTVRNIALALGFGRRITDRLDGGVKITYAEETIWNTSTRFVTFSMGTSYRLNERGFILGSSVSNMGTRARFSGGDLAIQYDPDPSVSGDNGALPAEQYTDRFPVPILFRVGMSAPHRLGPHTNLLFAVDALHPSNNTESLNAGAEWSWKDLFSLRAGYQTLFQDDSELGWTLGAGVATEIGDRELEFDYGWADHDRLEPTQRLTLVLLL